MDSEQPVAVLEDLLAVKGEYLLRTAVLLAGSHADGEDLLQAALERVFRHWRTIRGDPEGYLRRTPGPHTPHLHVISWWEYGTRSRQLIENAGQPVTDVRNVISHGKDTAIMVIYPERAWSSSTSPAAAPSSPDLCQTRSLPLADSAPDWKKLIESGLRCGAFTVNGRQRVDGIDAIRLTGRHFLPASTTLWVDPRSYLPIELVTHPDKADEERTGFRWLPPARASLALLSPPIPAGFRELSG